jgi:hypothetical protein
VYSVNDFPLCNLAHISSKRLAVNQKTWIFAQLVESIATDY